MHSFRASESSSRPTDRQTDVREGTTPQTSETSAFSRSLYDRPSSSRHSDATDSFRNQQERIEDKVKRYEQECPIYGMHNVGTSRRELAQAVVETENWRLTSQGLGEGGNQTIPHHILEGSDAARDIYARYTQALKDTHTAYINRANSDKEQISSFQMHVDGAKRLLDNSRIRGTARKFQQNKIVEYSQDIEEKNKHISLIEHFLANRKAEYQRLVPPAFRKDIE